MTYLHNAAKAGDLETIKSLLDSGAKIDATTRDSVCFVLHTSDFQISGGVQTALHIAAKHDQPEACKILAERGCPLEAGDKVNEFSKYF
jgi:ankyrin repeat protein